ncbi:MAG: adenylate/guanylate cyclase domain-containing response regulator [Nitrospirae bacterium]|nr:MAG: adenylate/guanylate cyclase domain-containing response regulator [Nitrospirota bacterium]
MNDPARILVVDDTPANVKLLSDLLTYKGYEVVTAASGTEALEKVETGQLDLVLLDILMPGMNGYEVCRTIRKNPATEILPVVLVTSLDPAEERMNGLQAGADDFLSKPVDEQELLVRVRSLLRIKELYDTVQVQSAQLAECNKTLEQRVHDQVDQLERLGRLKRFFSPQLAELIISGGADDPLKAHRREVTVVFLDLRGFTAFTEVSEPEEVISVLNEYHVEMSKLILEYEGTLEHFAGDGMMIIFNDPVLLPNPTERAVRMASAMRKRIIEVKDKWQKSGHSLDCGFGIAHGYATIGAIGFEGRKDYCVIGSVANMAARLCAEAKGGQVLINQKTLSKVEEIVETESLDQLSLKGFSKPVAAFNIIKVKD